MQANVIQEEDNEQDSDYYSEIFMEDLESGDTGSILDKAMQL